MQVLKRKSLLTIGIFVILLAMIFGFTANSQVSTFAETPTTPPNVYEATGFNTPNGYFYFKNPTAIATSDDNLYIADSNYIDVFSLTDSARTKIDLQCAPTKLAVYNQKFIKLCNNSITIDNTTIDGNFLDFCVNNNLLYALSSSDIIEYNIDTATTTTLLSNNGYKKIAASANAIYLTQTNANYIYRDDLLLFVKATDESWKIKAIAENIESCNALNFVKDNIASLTQSGIICYSGDYLKQIAIINNSNLINFSVNSDYIFALTDLKKVLKIPSDFSQSGEKYILAGASDETGFYNKPINAITRKGNLAIADKFNNRVVINTPNGVITLANLDKPSSVAIDNNGNYFIANDNKNITKYTNDFILETAQKITAPFDIHIKDMKFNANNDLYVLSSEGILYKIIYGTKEFIPQTILGQNIKITAFDISLDLDIVYTASNNTIYNFENGEVVLNANNITDFCFDHDNAIYVLDNTSNITKYIKGVAQTALPQITGIAENASSLTLNTITDKKNNLKYGDLIVTDTTTHSVKVVDGTVLQVNKNFVIKTKVELPFTDFPPTLADNDTSRIIYKLNSDCEVYADEAEISQVATLDKNMSIIIMNFDHTKKFNFIVADNLNDATLPPIVGYIFTSYINPAPLEYTLSHPEVCNTYINNVSIYAYPTKNSPKYSRFSLAKDTTLKLLDFCHATSDNSKYGYVDNFINSTTWYRVLFGDNFVGYVSSDFISIRGANPDMTIYPQTNAVVKSKDKKNPDIGAICYKKNADGNFIIIDELEPLLVGTKIEVVGAFDSTKDYTKVKFLSQYGTIEVWLQTQNIDYDGVNVVQIIALTIIIATLILLALIVWRVVYLKRIR